MGTVGQPPGEADQLARTLGWAWPYAFTFFSVLWISDRMEA
jgi:hypothetical protein